MVGAEIHLRTVGDVGGDEMVSLPSLLHLGDSTVRQFKPASLPSTIFAFPSAVCSSASFSSNPQMKCVL